MRVCSALALLVVLGLLAAEPDPWTSAEVLQPSAVAAAISGQNAPLLIHVGFPALYRSAHIPNSKYPGPGSRPAGIEELKKAVADVPRTRQIVLYCGCCPWTQCPNVRPAYKALREMGFTQVKVMEIPTNLRTDWTDKGYPIERPPA